MNEDFYIGLIYKQLDGTLTPTEKKQLNDWESSNEQNALTAHSVRTAWDLSANLKASPKIDLDAEFANLQSVLEKKQVDSKVLPIAQSKRNWQRTIRIAAAILLLPVLFFVINGILNNNDAQWAEIQTGQGEKQRIELSDGSMVTINENSFFRYPSKFDETERGVELSGEAFFEVTSNPQQAFKIKGPNLEVEVLGTSFSVLDQDVSSNSKVVVQEGKVAVRTLDNAKSLELTANEVATFSRTDRTLEKRRDPSLNSISWFTNRLVFKETPFLEMIQTLEENFRVNIQVENKELQTCTLDVTFEEEGLDTILSTLETVFGIAIESNEENTYLFKGGSCQ